MTDKTKKSGGRNLNFLFIVGLILAILIIVFALQNAEGTEVKFFRFSLSVPTALIIFGGLLLGSLLTLTFSVPGHMRRKKEHARLATEIRELRKNYEELAAVQPQKGPAPPVQPEAE